MVPSQMPLFIEDFLLEDFIWKGSPYCKPITTPYLSMKSLPKTFFYKGLPHLKLLFIKEIITISLCEAFIYKGIPNFVLPGPWSPGR
jgi:hypothetical protein